MFRRAERLVTYRAIALAPFVAVLLQYPLHLRVIGVRALITLRSERDYVCSGGHDNLNLPILGTAALRWVVLLQHSLPEVDRRRVTIATSKAMYVFIKYWVAICSKIRLRSPGTAQLAAQTPLRNWSSIELAIKKKIGRR